MSDAPPAYDEAGLTDHRRNNVALPQKIQSGTELIRPHSREQENGDFAVSIGLSERTTASDEPCAVVYKLYKRRWIGLIQLVLMNMAIGWNV